MSAAVRLENNFGGWLRDIELDRHGFQPNPLYYLASAFTLYAYLLKRFSCCSMFQSLNLKCKSARAWITVPSPFRITVS